MANILISIVLCFNIFIPGKCQRHEIFQPHTVLNASGIITYNCEFIDSQVDCIWKNDGKTIRIFYSKFKYAMGNGERTKDCSISTSDIETASKHQNMQCIGIQRRFQDITVSENSIQLNCTSTDKINCEWRTHNFDYFRRRSRYSYIDGHNGINVKDCSIRINNINASIDEGEWICYANSIYSSYKSWILIVSYNLKVTKKATTSIKITRAITSSQVPTTATTSYKSTITSTLLESTTAITSDKSTNESLSIEKTTVTYPPSSGNTFYNL
ncbi:hypothetical protein CHUAL_011368 [Chamberlinius hualienensis]